MLKAKDLVAFAKKAYLEDWGYVLGGQGETYTPEFAEKWAVSRNKPSTWVGTKRSYFTDACARWFGHTVADCSGLIIAAFRMLMSSRYQDQKADTLFDRCSVKGKMSTLPEIPGVCLHKSGHIGIYIGGGYAIEARGYKYGVVKTKVKSRAWKEWGKLKDVDYSESSGGGGSPPMPMLSKGDTGEAVRRLQALLNKNGARLKVDGIFGSKTRAAVIAYQKKHRLQVDGIAGPETWGSIL